MAVSFWDWSIIGWRFKGDAAVSSIAPRTSWLTGSIGARLSYPWVWGRLFREVEESQRVQCWIKAVRRRLVGTRSWRIYVNYFLIFQFGYWRVYPEKGTGIQQPCLSTGEDVDKYFRAKTLVFSGWGFGAIGSEETLQKVKNEVAGLGEEIEQELEEVLQIRTVSIQDDRTWQRGISPSKRSTRRNATLSYSPCQCRRQW